jgi:hypothetical protein
MGRRDTKVEVYLQAPLAPKSFASVESNGTLPSWVLMERSPTDRFLEDALSHQLLRRCRIDRLSWQR